MISGSTKISVLDCNTGSYMYEPIKYIISYDIRDLHQIPNGVEVKYNNVKIQNWFGWTDLLSIKRISIPDANWYIVGYRKEPYQCINVTEDELLMVFDPNTKIHTANGLFKFKYDLLTPKQLEKFTDRPILRSRSLNDTIESPNQFTEGFIISNPCYSKLHAYGYIITTAIGSYNAESLMCHAESPDITDPTLGKLTKELFA